MCGILLTPVMIPILQQLALSKSYSHQDWFSVGSLTEHWELSPKSTEASSPPQS